MTVVANLTVAGITRGKRYDVIKKDGNCVMIVLDDGTIAFRHIRAVDIISE